MSAIETMNAKMIGENPIKTNKAKAEDQIIIYYAIQSTVVKFNLEGVG